MNNIGIEGLNAYDPDISFIAANAAIEIDNFINNFVYTPGFFSNSR